MYTINFLSASQAYYSRATNFLQVFSLLVPYFSAKQLL